jgi:hypothetical protein
MKSAFTLFWVIGAYSISFLFLFGTVVDKLNYNGPDIMNSLMAMAESSMMDYDCVGQRVWLFICVHAIPNVIITFMTLLI